jgi:predicted nucleotide-binding protein (sugar kinase/HSP70/actin superfamily)
MAPIGDDSEEDEELGSTQRDTWNKFRRYSEEELKKKAEEIWNELKHEYRGQSLSELKKDIRKKVVKVQTILAIYHTKQESGGDEVIESWEEISNTDNK